MLKKYLLTDEISDTTNIIILSFFNKKLYILYEKLLRVAFASFLIFDC